MSNKKNKKVLVGLSGGVDSAVSAALLLEQGFEVIGAFMKNWSDCDWQAEKRDATRVAAKLGIPIVFLDFESEYRDRVVAKMISEYAAGRTPNPDVLCNKHIKFDLFVREADDLGCDWVATGHYARVKDGQLYAGTDKNKDQSYFLWAMPRQALDRVIFPVGEMEKSEVRARARELGLSVANKKDSVGICFVGEINVPEFLKSRIAENPGEVVTSSGEVVGEHDGLAFYTIGQRQGLGIGGGRPFYVVGKDFEKNRLLVSSNYEPELYRDSLIAHDLNLLTDKLPRSGQARVRYRQELVNCDMEIDGEKVKVEFAKPVRAITPGQSIVFYFGEQCLGGGVIE